MSTPTPTPTGTGSGTGTGTGSGAGRRASRRAAQDAAREARKADTARQVRRYRWPALGVVVVLLAIVVIVIVRGGGSSHTPPSASGRSKSTLLIQLVPVAGRPTSGNALTAATTSGTGVFMTLPGQLITDVPGRGATTLDQTPVIGNGTTAAEALADQLNVLVDGSWVLTYQGFARLIDKVGGVTVDVDTDVTATRGGSTIVLVPQGSKVSLTGTKAVAYATFLGANGTEEDRMARFSDVWSAFLGKLPNDVDATRALITGTQGSVSTMSPDKLAAYLVSLHQAVVSDSVTYPTVPTVSADDGAGSSTVRLDNPKVPAVIKREFAGALPPTRPGGAISALVQNGVGTPGLLEKARAKLIAADITFQSGGNATRIGYPNSLVLLSDASDASQAKGAAVAKALGLPQSSVRVASQGQTLADVLVILGSDFHG